MSNEDGTVWVVFNGEVYNFPALRRRLEGAGHTFRTNSDTETIVHLFEDEGLDFVQHLNGMFAIAIWDSNQRRLVLARDRIGQKPLVYRHEPGRLLFASELKSLLQVADFPRDLDAGAIDEYLTYQYVPHPKTIFTGTRKLPPGHLAVYQDDKLSVQTYWQPDLNHEIQVKASVAAERLVELMTSSVEMRMQSDVPLGAFLSGGVDSSLIVALMQQRSQQPIKTFTIGFPIAEYDETSYARQVANHLGTEHEELQVTPDGVSILPKLVWNYDEPFGDSSAIPTWYVSEMTRRQVTVALSGDGGDELFAGYPRYKAVWLASQCDRLGPIRSFLAAPAWQKLPGSRQKSFVRRFKRFSEFLGKTPQRRYLEWIAIFNESRRATLYRDDFVERLPDSDPFRFLGNAWARAGSRDVVTGASLADLTTYLPCDLNTKVDIASMAHGLEVRQPFLDYRVVEYAASLPLSLKFRRGQGKLLLRRAFGHLLPRAIWQRRKMG
ncbi:MAG: asparagine synthase (glutamine-hydrolyzing), partial [Planctomycetota bacterium]